MFAWNARPPTVGTLANYLARLEGPACVPWVNTWMQHQTRDKYWAQGSICEDYTAITCPVLLIGGW